MKRAHIFFLILGIVSLLLSLRKGKRSDDLRIKRITLYHVNVPLGDEFFPSWFPGYALTHNRFTLVEIESYNGLKGYSSGVSFSNEREGIGDLVTFLIDHDCRDVGGIHHLLDEMNYLGSRNYWIENAVYDILSQDLNIPLWSFLGGQNDSIPVYLSTGEELNIAKHSKLIKWAKGEGYHGVKIRLPSGRLNDSVGLIRELRNSVGNSSSSSMPIYIDMNQCWHGDEYSVSEVLEFIDQIKDCGIGWIEEPFHIHRYEDYATLRKNSCIPIAGGELGSGWSEFRMMMDIFHSMDIVQPDSTFIGISDTLKVVQNAKKSTSLFVSPHTFTNGIGLLLNMHVYALTDHSVPLEFPYEEGSFYPEAREGIFKDTITPINGYLSLPKQPGAGIKERISPWKLRKYSKVFFTMTKRTLYLKMYREKGLLTMLRMFWQRKKIIET